MGLPCPRPIFLWDAPDWKAGHRKGLWVEVPPSVLKGPEWGHSTNTFSPGWGVVPPPASPSRPIPAPTISRLSGRPAGKITSATVPPFRRRLAIPDPLAAASRSFSAVAPKP